MIIKKSFDEIVNEQLSRISTAMDMKVSRLWALGGASLSSYFAGFQLHNTVWCWQRLKFEWKEWGDPKSGNIYVSKPEKLELARKFANILQKEGFSVTIIITFADREMKQ